MTTEQKSLGKRILEIPYWYHRIELPSGDITPGWAPICAEKYAIPTDLTGKRVLDIGAWDGYWTWEALKRGAKEVVAIDDFSDNLGCLKERTKWDTFDLCREAFGFVNIDIDPEPNYPLKYWENDKKQRVRRLEMSVFDISEEDLGRFDIVFFFGTVYHLKHPLLALEKISAICDGEIYIETAALDDYSPYRNVIGKGYNDNDVVMEFYPGKQYGNNENNWWVPTLQCLGAMVASVGFKNVEAWGLTDKPANLAECRGFVYGSKKGLMNPLVDKFVGTESENKRRALSVAGVMSVPRLGFMDNSFCVIEAVVPLKIPIFQVQGAFWGQCLERGIQQQIDAGYEAILTIDYDTVFGPDDVQELVRLMIDHPEADAIISMHQGRSNMGTLLTMKTKTGQVREIISREEFLPELTKVTTGHFGLTLLRTSSLLKMPHPWFWSQPATDGQWNGGRVDDDIYFWKQMEKLKMNIYLANRVVVGHLELMITWPDKDLRPTYQTTADFRKNGKSINVWK
jgi:tRNA (mo5U34)-methyltransferase